MAATSYEAAACRKKAQLIHPPKSNFLKMEAAALICLKTAAWPLFGRKISSATTAVFFIPQGSTPFTF